MPRIWKETIAAHREDVRQAIIEATQALVDETGLVSVTMSDVAQTAGIGRATLYKYFSDIESILAAWHERQITAHMDHLATVRDQDEDPGRRLRSVLEAYALMRYESRGNHDTGLAALLHKDDQVVQAEERLHDMVRDLLADSAEAGDVRVDVTVPELATYCLHALGAASSLRSRAAVHRLVSVTITGLTGRS